MVGFSQHLVVRAWDTEGCLASTQAGCVEEGRVFKLHAHVGAVATRRIGGALL